MNLRFFYLRDINLISLKAIEQILPMAGVGPIKFGMKQSEAEDILGTPTEVEIVNEVEEMYNAEIWHYDELEISLSFDNNDGSELSEISIANPEIHLEGKIKVGISLSELILLLQSLGWKQYETESLLVNEVEEVYLLDLTSHNLMFWFEDGHVCEIQMSR